MARSGARLRVVGRSTTVLSLAELHLAVRMRRDWSLFCVLLVAQILWVQCPPCGIHSVYENDPGLFLDLRGRTRCTLNGHDPFNKLGDSRCEFIK